MALAEKIAKDHPPPVHASKNTDSSVFYTEIETKILNTDSDPKNTDRDSDRYTANYSDLAMKKGKVECKLVDTTKVAIHYRV